MAGKIVVYTADKVIVRLAGKIVVYTADKLTDRLAGWIVVYSKQGDRKVGWLDSCLQQTR